MRLIFMGTPEAAVPTVRRCIEDGHEVVAVWTQPDRPSGRGNKLHPPPVKDFALTHDLPVYQPAKIRNDETLSLFTSQKADAAVVVAYGRILPAPFLHTPRLGCINVHFSLLPEYRGAAPVAWAIVRGESRTGVTTMQMDEGLDTGPILLQEEVVIASTETGPELMARLSASGAALLSETLTRFAEIVPRQQSEDKATFAPVLTREDGIIDFALDATQIERRVRGFQPWPNAYTRSGMQRLIIWKASVVTEPRGEGEPGEIRVARKNDLIVSCGADTLLRLEEVQPEGKRRMSAADFLNGAGVQPGDRLG